MRTPFAATAALRAARAGVLAAVAALVGCQQQGPAPPRANDQPPAPATLTEAHRQLEELGEQIQSAFEAGEPERAHDALHEIGRVIQALPRLASEAGVEAEAEVDAVTDDLMDGYARLDGVLHNAGEATWDDVGETIDGAMAKLEGWLPEDDGG